MIRDLLETEDDRTECRADIVVVGSGPAGLITASQLSAAGLRVVVLESGARVQEPETHPFNRVEQSGQDYSGAEHGRFRCLGGTSTRWGGAMMPFLEADVTEHTANWVSDWRIPFKEVMAFLPVVEKIFDLPSGGYFDQVTIEGDRKDEFHLNLAKWPSFGMRNIATACADRIGEPDGPEVWLNAHVTGLNLNERGRLASVAARSVSGRTLSVTASEFVVAAGAIESTRLLLLLDRQNDDKVFAPDAVLGRNLTDHLSAKCADIHPIDRSALNKIAGFSFEGRAMRNLRFVMTGQARRHHQLPAGYCHISFASDESSGFSGLRRIFRALQQKRAPMLADIVQMLADLPWLTRAVWWRYFHHRLLYPSGAQIYASVAIEQMPKATNCITLSEDTFDGFGQPLARIHWEVGSEDIDNFACTSGRFIDMWRSGPLSSVAKIEAVPEATWKEQFVNCGGVYHPAGTIRIGATPEIGVVGPDLTTFRVPNLHVVSTAVFPVSGSANPTMMMMLYGCFLAERLAKGLSDGGSR